MDTLYGVHLQNICRIGVTFLLQRNLYDIPVRGVFCRMQSATLRIVVEAIREG